MEACAVICRKGKRLCGYASRCQFSLFPVPIPVSPSTKSGFCALLRSGTPVFWLFKHKIGVFVLFWPSEPPFSGISSTKSGFLCAFSLRAPHFRAFRAQNQGFCALLAFGTPVYRLFKHKIGVFVPGSCCSGCGSVYLFAPRRAKSSFLKVAASVKSSACMPAAMAPSTLAGLSSVKRHSEALSPNFWQSRS